MSEYIVNVPDEEAEYFIARFGFENVKLTGYSLTGEIVRCKDCVFSETHDGKEYPIGERGSVYCLAWSDGMQGKWTRPDGFCHKGKRKEDERMSMCYLCDMCAYSHDGGVFLLTTECTALFNVRRNKLPIDYGKQDPHEICKHFKPKEGGE